MFRRRHEQRLERRQTAASARAGAVDTVIERGHAADAGTAIAENSDRSRRRAARGNMTITAITRTRS